MFDERKRKAAVERWVSKQDLCPSRKQAVATFPEVPQRIIRAVIQSRKDKDREGAEP